MMKLFRVAVALALMGMGPVLAQAPAPSPAPGAGAKPAHAAHSSAKPALGAGSKVDINSAGAAQLEVLPQIGAARAKAIVAGRPYEELQDLVKKKVLTQGIFDKAKGGMALANINSSTAAEMVKTLPGIGEARAKDIVAGRPYSSPQDLVTKKVLTEGVFEKVKDVVAW